MVNRVTLVGRVGNDPETHTLRDSTKTTRLSLATTEAYTDKLGNRVETTEWHSVTLWRGLAGIAEKYVRKGDLLYVEGKLHHSTFEDRNGQKQHRTEVVADSLRMLGRKREENPPAQPVQPQPTLPGQSAFSLEPDDLPF